MTDPIRPTRATLLISAEYPGYVVRGGLAEDSPPIPLMKVLRHFVPDIPATDEALLVSALTFEADPPSKRYVLQGQIDNVWSIPLGFDLPGGEEATFDLESLAFAVSYLTNYVGVFIRGDLALFDTRFTLTAARPPAADAAWTFTGNLADDETIPVARVVTDLIVLATGEDLTVPDSLAGLNVHHVGFSVDTGTSKHYAFWGSLTWTIPAGDSKSLVVDADVDVDSWLPDVATGAPRPQRLYDLAVRGAVSFEDFDDGDFFQNFSVEASYSHTNRTGGADDQITFALHKDHLTLAAALSFGTGEDTKLTISFGDTTFGDILNFMVQLVDPDIEDFRFDPPWDMLSDISLSGLEIELNLTRKEAVVRYEINQDFGFVRIDFLGLRYLRNAAGKSTVNVEIVGRFLDQTYGEDDPLAWDALDDAPPETPGAGSAIFDLNYLGLGQHIALQNVADLTTVDAVMDALIHAIEDGDSVELLAFDADSGWLIGAKFSVIGAVDLSVIFNDPVVYGLLIALKGDKVKALAGLRFEILYRKITNTIGVYRTELTLPDAMRQFNVGAVAITLPVIALEIYTNGDFKVDVGFPWREDWSRSAVVEASIFIGSGGFYFAKLSGETSTRVPRITNGNFNPVIEFGLGLKLGVGRTFNKGPLKAELSVTIQGIFEGVLAWFNPTNPATPDATYYWLQATVQLVGRLYGAVDFEVIKVEVEVLVYAGIRLTIEAYQPIVIELVAGVKVKASVKVLFVKVHFSFSLTVRESFTIGHAEPTPWHIAAGTRSLDLFARTLPAPPTPLFWQPIAVWDSVQPLPVLFQPAFSKGMVVDQPGASPPEPTEDDPTPDPTEAKGIALLFVPNGIPAQADAPEDFTTEDFSAAADPAPFDQLGQSLLAWALHAYLADPNNPPPLHPVGSATPGSPFSPTVQGTTVRRADLSALYDALVQRNDSHQLPFSLQSVLDFLAANFKIGIDLAPANVDTSAAIFPMPPMLHLDVTGQDSVDFAAHRLLDSATLRSLYAYFDDLRTHAADEATARTRDLAPPMSLATFLFVDYFAMITRMAVQSAVEHMDDNDLATAALPDLLTAMQQRGRFNHIAGMVSRFLLHGLRLPAAVDGEETYPLYALSGQQFAVPAALPADFSIALSADSVPGWLRFGPEPPPPAEDETPPPPVTRIAYVPATADRAFVAALAATAVAPAILRQDATPRYQPAPQRFALEHAVDWSRAAGDRRIWQLPAKLQDQLAAETTFPVNLLAGRRQPSGPTGLVTAPVTDAAWATRIKFQLRRIPGEDGEPLADTYLVLGADAVGVDLLEALWRQMTAPVPAATELFLLHKADGGLAEDADVDVLLLKTNLSTITRNPDAPLARSLTVDEPRYAATLVDNADFVRLLWEASTVVSGGFFLRYRTGVGNALPDVLFDADDSAELHLLVRHSAATSSVSSVYNAVVTAPTLVDDPAFAPADTVFFAERTDRPVFTLSLPQPQVGFVVERTPPADTVTPADHLDNLYQMLSYRVLAGDGFRATRPGMPVGPTVDDNDPNTAADDRWSYKRAIPATRLLSTPPADAADPYAAVGADTQITVDFDFLDIYGNRSVLAAPPANLALPTRYVDPLVGINQWPGFNAGYRFQRKDDATVTLHVDLGLAVAHFVPAADVPPDEIQRRVDAGVEAYRTVVHQLSREDVSITLRTSLMADAHTLPRTEIAQCTAEIYAFLRRLQLTGPTDDARFVTPPSALAFAIDLARDPAQYPDDLIFPVGVQIDIDRDPALVSSDVENVPEIQHITSYLSPVTAREDGAPITLRDFAAAFEDGFPGLKLAVGRNLSGRGLDQNASAGDPQPPTQKVGAGETMLWAVHLGEQGIGYVFDAGSTAQFFAPAPLSTQPVSGEVRLDRYAEDGLHADGPTQRFAAADLDAWARSFLAAVDRFLDPDVVTPAYAVAADSVRAVLGHKRALAAAFAARVEPVFADGGAPAESTVRRDAAAETLRQQLLQTLEAAYTIETVVQLGVDVTLPEGASWTSVVAPRLAGKPVTVGDVDSEATLSACKLSLAPGRSFLSFLYNTADPGAARSRTLDLAFRVTDLEKEIAPLSGFDGYERSSWLSFVLPLGADPAHHIGAVTIPIPLRAYPLPPSLIRHQGEADPDSVTALDAVRQWQYRYVYEHLDVAQDVINTDITFNAVSQITPPATSAGTEPRSLFEALANFVTIYPAIAADLDQLKTDGGDPANATAAIAAFAQLVGEVSAALSPRGGRSLGRGVVESVRYAISERHDEDDTLHVTITTVRDGLTPPPAGTRTPQIEIAGYTQNGPPVIDGDETRYTFVPTADAPAVTGLGHSSLPDRALIVPDLDVIQQQLATASIWLTRNRELVDGRVTNPSFVYETPRIRFRDSTSPLVQNRTPWDIAAIGSPTGAAQRRPLAAHVDALFAALLPAVAQNDYAIRIAVRYRFNLAEAGAQPLFSSLPVLLGPRFPIDAGADLLPATADLRANLVRTLERWQQTMQPSTAQSAYQFRVAIFSRLRAGTAANNLPLLQIEDLSLQLGDVET